MICGTLARRKSFQAEAVDHENIQVIITVIIKQRDSTTGTLEHVLFRLLPAVDDTIAQTGCGGDIEELNGAGRVFLLTNRKRTDREESAGEQNNSKSSLHQ